MRTIIGLGGAPATGKSLIVRTVLKRHDPRSNLSLYKQGTLFFHKSEPLYVLGKYRDGDEFPGTDRLSMAVVGDAERFLHSLPQSSVVLFEGDRLFCNRFLDACREAGDRCLFMVLCVSGEEFRKRHERRDQRETFVKGRLTKYRNIIVERGDITTRRNDTQKQHAAIVHEIERYIKENAN